MDRTTPLGNLPSKVAVAEGAVAIENTAPLESACEEEETRGYIQVERAFQLVDPSRQTVRSALGACEGKSLCPLAIVSGGGRWSVSEDLRCGSAQAGIT